MARARLERCRWQEVVGFWEYLKSTVDRMWSGKKKKKMSQGRIHHFYPK